MSEHDPWHDPGHDHQHDPDGRPATLDNAGSVRLGGGVLVGLARR